MKSFSFWNHSWALSVSAALLLSLSFPPFNLSVLQVPAFVILFRLAVISNSSRQLIYFAYPSFVLWNLLTTYWLMMATVAGGLAAILANALLMLIPLLLIRKLFLSNMNSFLAAFLAASFWVTYEFLHHNWDLSWPWLTLGNGWANITGAIQFISFTGVWGISFWIMLTASLLFLYIREKKKSLLYGGISVFLAFPLLSVLLLTTQQQETANPVDVTIIQPNSDSYEDFGGLSSADELITKLLTLSAEAYTPETDVLIWPENALDSNLPFDHYHFNRIRDSLDTWNTSLITGTGFVDYYDEDNRPPVFRESVNGTYNVYNSAFHLHPDQPNKVYKKGKLVPIVERLPFVETFQRLDALNWVDWGVSAGYGLGTEATVFDLNGHKTPALICYDSVFPGWVNKFVNRGAGFLTIITNDGWWGKSNGHIQHFAYARLRAIEHRKWIARSANNGISGIIGPDGRIHKETEYWTEDAFSHTIYSTDSMTIYSEFGDWLGFLLTISTLAGLTRLRMVGKDKST
ncbi:MAG: apolipoprotein N-acyltransferase [Balneolaceae bacterium]